MINLGHLPFSLCLYVFSNINFWVKQAVFLTSIYAISFYGAMYLLINCMEKSSSEGRPEMTLWKTMAICSFLKFVQIAISSVLEKKPVYCCPTTRKIN